MSEFTLLLTRELGDKALDYALRREACLLAAGFPVAADKYRQAVRELVTLPNGHFAAQ